MPTAPTVAVLGLGAMGLPMATRLASALPVVAFDVAAERIRLAADAGVGAASTPAQACSSADVVLIGVRNAAQLDAALFGPDGAAGTLREGAIVVLTSTVGTDVAQAAAARLALQGVDLLDAPVSGGAVRAAAGDLLIMVGAAPEVVERARPVLDLLASTVHVVGPAPGDGQTMKTVNQLLCGIHTAAAAEALALTRALGLDLDTAIQVLGSGAAASFMLADRGPRMVQQYTEQGPELRSRLDIISKDMGIVNRLVRQAGVAAPVAAAAEHLYLLGQAQGLSDEDDSVLVTLLSPRGEQG
jgi:3-hydroxyisobutyrate dehydrogenase